MQAQAGEHPTSPLPPPELFPPARTADMLKTSALQDAIFNSAHFSSIATDARGVIQIFNVGAERMLGYAAADVVDKLTPAELSDSQEITARAAAAFKQFARNHRNQQGLGLGLAIARSVAEIGGGRLILQPGPDARGLHATLDLPCA